MAARPHSEPRLSTAPRPALRALLLIGVPAVFTAVLLGLPWGALDSFTSRPAGAVITDRTGAFLALVPGEGGAFQEKVAVSAIPPKCASLFVRLEDSRFYGHPGIDAIALVRALALRATGRAGRSGASTITMQLARLVAPHPRTLAGKMVEAAEALRIESRYTKDRILALYLNSLPFGRNTRGVGAAAWAYFGQDLSRLSDAQLLVLAIIPRNPTLYDPVDHPSSVIAAARAIDARAGLGISAGAIDAAVRGAASGRPTGGAPHFSRYVTSLLSRGDIHAVDGVVRTTLDLGLNDFIQARLRFILERYAAARVTNASAVVIDNASGGVLAWVGSRDFTDEAHSGQVDGVLIRRQSASTLKPFLYARALESGATAATLLPDVAMVFGAADEQAYRPENFDKRSHGVVRLRTALASSLNVPAVYMLSQVGVPAFLATLGELGFRLPADARARYGLGAAIGNAEVSLLELTHAFSVFPDGGSLPPLTTVEGPAGAARRIFDPFSAWMITSILSDPSARVTGFGTRTYFSTPFPAMFKSGTSSEFTNLWCVGATPRFTVGVWAGNFDGRAVINKTGSIIPTQIVTDVLEEVIRSSDPSASAQSFDEPADVVEARICTVTGKRATPSCPSTRIEYFRSASEVPGPCAYHAGHETPESLLQETFLKPSQGARILFPVSGQVFYRDAALASGTQDLPVVVAAAAGSSSELLLDGEVLARGGALSEVRVPLLKGHHVLLLSGKKGSDRVSFDVEP